jgi:penicillin-binding protein 1B
MKELGEITDEEYTQAQSSPIVLNRTKIHRLHIPHFKRILEEHLASKHSVEADPSVPNTIYTGINFELQLCAENAVEATLQDLEKKSPRLRGKPVEQSLVAIEPFSGVIKAWVGGRSFSKNQFDHVTQAKRPIGSTIKPFLYITAMEPKLNSYKVATAISILSDVPTGITLFDNAKWLPKNFDRKYRGDVTLRYALEKSLNIPAVYVAQRIGIPALANTLSLFSIAESIPKVPALALGAVETSLLKLVSGYSTIANGGVRVDPRLFFSVLNQKKSLEVSTTASEKPVVSEGVAYLMTDILRGVVDRGTANIVRKLNYTGPAAGKTGTSNDARDAWFIGFTPELATGVWTGFDDNHVLGITGGEASAPTWARFMKCAEPFLSGLDFLPPPSVISLNIDTRCYGLATKSTPPDKVISEIFVKGSQPKEPCRELEEAPSTQQVRPPASDLKNDKEIERVPSPEQTPDFKDNQPGFWERIFG